MKGEINVYRKYVKMTNLTPENAEMLQWMSEFKMYKSGSIGIQKQYIQDMWLYLLRKFVRKSIFSGTYSAEFIYFLLDLWINNTPVEDEKIGLFIGMYRNPSLETAFTNAIRIAVIMDNKELQITDSGGFVPFVDEIGQIAVVTHDVIDAISQRLTDIRNWLSNMTNEWIKSISVRLPEMKPNPERDRVISRLDDALLAGDLDHIINKSVNEVSALVMQRLTDKFSSGEIPEYPSNLNKIMTEIEDSVIDELLIHTRNPLNAYKYLMIFDIKVVCAYNREMYNTTFI